MKKVTFKEDLIHIKEYELNNIEIIEKKEIFKRIKKNNTDNERLISCILYKFIPSKINYLLIEIIYHKKIINFIKINELTYIYFENNKFISYIIYENGNNKLCINIIPSFKMIKTHEIYTEYLDDNQEYEAKIYVINTMRKLFNDNDIY
jgi:hypothetical protein